jgi:hypothetical protein
MKKYIYYHIYLTDETGCWYNLFLDQLYSVIDSGLYDNIEKMYVVCIGKSDEIDLFAGICNCYSKIQILKKLYLDKDKKENLSLQHTSSIDYEKNNFYDEVQTMSLLQEHANREDAQFLYFHSKGITAAWRMREEKHSAAFINYYLWRKFLQWGCIENWKICSDSLKNHSCAGVNLGTWPVPHYSGTFWWTKSEYVRTLPDINENDWWQELRKTTPLNTYDSNRNKPEMWIGTKFNNDFYNIISCEVMPPEGTPIQYHWPKSKYEWIVK